MLEILGILFLFSLCNIFGEEGEEPKENTKDNLKR